MTINTQKLRDLIRRAVPLPWALATSNSYRRIVRADRYEEVCSPVKMPDGHPDLWFPDGFEGPNAQLLIGAVNALPDLLDIIDAANEQVAEYARMLEKQSTEADARIDAQAAEIARLKAAQAWQPIETAPKYIWVLIWREGIVPRVAMLTEPFREIPPEEIKHEIRDADDNEQGWWSDAYGWQDGSDAPTHWMPLPAGPGVPGESHDR